MKKKIQLSHNDYFQRQFQRIEFAVSFIKENLPEEIVKRINFKTLRLAPGDFVKDSKKESIRDKSGWFQSSYLLKSEKGPRIGWIA